MENERIFNLQEGNRIIEFEKCDDGGMLISCTDDFTIFEGVDFLLNKEQADDLMKFMYRLNTFVVTKE